MPTSHREPTPGTPPPRIVLIGRAAGNDLVVRAAGVSARHARVLVEEDGLWLEDLGSRNGTFVGTPPRRIQRERIALDETITLGDAVLPVTALEDLLKRTRPRDPAEGRIELDDAALVTFGRSAAADVPLGRPLASALHASVSVDRGRVIVRDLGSTDGTFVDGRRIDRAVEIAPGTIVQIGDKRFRLAPDSRALEPIDGSDRDVLEVDSVTVEASGKRLLEGVSLVVEPGELVAIIGPSGAGKSVLISVLNGQAVPKTGRMIIGGLDLNDHYDLFRGRIGYVPQDDILHADLTVWQALWYAARLRLPRDTTATEIEARIRAVIHELGLDGTEHTRVGDQRQRGVSGGQRKRVNLGMELLTDPPILVLDEPTSGLSSVDALSVIEILRNLADSGKTILVAIHQPSLAVFEKFDAVAVIARDDSTGQVGRLAWFGRAYPDSITFFEPAAPGTPPPTSVDGLLRGLATRPVAEWVRQWEQSIAKSIWVDRRATTSGTALPPRTRRRPRVTAPFTQWLTLVKRTVAVKAADGWGTLVLFAQAPLVGLLIAAVFSKVVRSAPTPETWPKVGVSMATTMFVTALAAIWFGCSSMAREIVTEWPIYRRERMVGLSIAAYVASKMTALLAIAAVQCLLLVAVVAPACGIDSSWLGVFLTLYAAALAGGAIGLLLSATLKTTEAVSGVLPVLLLPMIVLGGILVPLSDLPSLTQPIAAAMPSRWAFEGLVVPEADRRPRIQIGGPPRAKAESPSPASAREELPREQGDPATAAAPTAGDTTSTRTKWVFHLAGQGGEKQTFLLPGRRKIVEKLEEAAEEAAGQAKQEIEKAKKTIEEKAEKIQNDIKAEMEKRVVEAKEQARRESADAREQVRREVEQKVAIAKADARRESDETAARIRAEMESKVAEAQAAAKRESDTAGTAARADIEQRVRGIQADFERRTREATEQLEAKLRQMEEVLSAERVKMNDALDSVRALTEQTILPPAGSPDQGAATAAPSGNAASPGIHGAERPHPDSGPAGRTAGARAVDMADLFFASGSWRSPRGLPLTVLLGMFATGIIGTGIALRWRDSSGR